MAAVAIMAASGGYFFAMILNPGESHPTGVAAEAFSKNQIEEVLGRRRPDFVLKDGSGNPVSAADFDGQILLVNFWATWCTPCVEEMPMLSELHESHAQNRLQVVGIALDDPQKATEFAAELNIDYPVLFGTTDAILVGRQYGNRAGMLPYSVLVDRAGIIQWTFLGALKREEIEAQIRALL